MLHGTESSLSELRIPCAVCGGKSSGFHYGIHACEGCKGFFRRTNRLKLTYKTCNDSCKVNVRTRNNCQYCRFQKCIRAGMSHNAIRFGRISRDEKQRLASRFSGSNSYREIPRVFTKPPPDPRVSRLIHSVSSSFQLHISTTQNKMDNHWNSFNSHQLPYHHIDSVRDIQKLYPQLRTPLNQHSYSISDSAANALVMDAAASGIIPEMKYSQSDICDAPTVEKEDSLRESPKSPSVDKTPILTYETNRFVENYREIGNIFHHGNPTNDISFRGHAMGETSVAEETRNSDRTPSDSSIDPNVLYFARKLQFRIADAICAMSYFLKGIAGFRDLPIPDQVILLKYGSCEAAFVLVSTCLREQGLLLPTARLFITTKFLESMGGLSSIMKPKLEFARKIAAFNLNDKELALYTAVIFLNGERPSLSSVKQVDAMRANLLEALEAAIDDAGHEQVQIYAKLLHRIADLKQIFFEHAKVIRSGGLRNILTPLVDEIFES